MIRELQLHRKSPRSVQAYVTAVAQLARHHERSPDAISIEEVRDFLHYLITERKVAFSTCNQKLAGIRFFYRQVLGQEGFSLRVPAKRSGRLPDPLSRSEIGKLLEATQNTKHRVLLGIDITQCPRCGRPLHRQVLRPWHGAAAHPSLPPHPHRLPPWDTS